MKIFSSLLCLLAFSALWISCSKKSDPDPAQPTKTDHITASAWVYDNAGIDQDKNGTIDLPLSVIAPSVIPTCVTDNKITFSRNNTGSTDEGPLKCNTTDPQTSGFNWSFADNEANLNISNNISALLNGKSKIVTLTATNFTLSRDTTIPFLNNVALVVSLKH
jgi:hypothetical protein